MAYIKNQNKKKDQRRQLNIKKFYLNEGNTTYNREYDRSTLIDILNIIPFDKISIPVFVHRSFIEEDGKGYINVGYVKSYDSDNEIFNVVIKDTCKQIIDDLGESVIYTRVAVDNNGNVKNIIGIDIIPVYDDEDLDEAVDEDVEE